jgi:hypothetical protein
MESAAPKMTRQQIAPDHEIIPGTLFVFYEDLRPGREGQRAPFLFRLREDARCAARDGARAAAVGAMAATSVAPGNAGCPTWKSGPIKATYDGQIIQWQNITSTNGPALDVNGHKGVIVKNSVIHHRGGPGVVINGPWFSMQDTIVVSDDHAWDNIDCINASNIWLRNVTVAEGAAGIEFEGCSHIERNSGQKPARTGVAERLSKQWSIRTIPKLTMGVTDEFLQLQRSKKFRSAR